MGRWLTGIPVATADIPADTVLFTIPRASIISKETSALVKRLPAVFDSTTKKGQDQQQQQHQEDHDMDNSDDDDDDDSTQQDSWTTLILILIYEHLQGDASAWKPYLDLLPADPTAFSTPMFWSDAELAELQASPVAARVGRADADAMIRAKILPVVRAHEDVFFPSGSPISSDDELIALAFRMGSVIMAYAFDLEKDEDDEDDDEDENEDEWVEDRETATSSTLGMVPMADVLNADAAFNAHIEHGADALAATALRPIARGDEILNYYGPLSCGELLRRYGYVTPTHRRWNLVDLAWAPVLAALRGALGLRDDDEWEKVMRSIDEDEEGGGLLEEEEDFVVDRGASDPDSEGRVAEVVGRAGPPEELVEQLKEVIKAVKKVRPDAVPDKIARDRAIYTAIATALEERTRQYGTTLEQDLELYDKTAGGAAGALDRKRMALDVRIGEKVLLKQASETVKEKLAGLAAAARDGDGRSAKRRKM